MVELSARARRVLDLARQADVPAPDAQRRVERALAARIASGAGPSPALLGQASTPLAVKALAPLGLAVIAAGAGWFGMHSEPASQSQDPVERPAEQTPRGSVPLELPPRATDGAPRERTVEPPASDVPPSPAVESAAPELAPSAPRAAVRKPEPRAVSPRATTAASLDGSAPTLDGSAPTLDDSEAVAPRGTPPSAPPEATAERDAAPPAAAPKPTPDPLLAEALALKDAQRALRSGDTDHALELLSRQDRTFAAGSLQQERAAARILALCQAGRAEQARALTARFVERWPRSALRARVTSACRAE